MSADHEHKHSAHAPWAAFVDELWRLGHVDAEKRTLLRRGMPLVAPAAAALPSSQGLPAFEGAARRAESAGLVKRTESGLHLGCSPETVHWGYLSGAIEPVAFVQSGDTVTIDTVSHEGLMPDQGAPHDFFQRRGIAQQHLLADAAALYSTIQHSGMGPHIVSGPVHVAGAEPGDTLAVHIIEARPRTPYGVNSMRTGKGGLPDEFTLNRSVVIPFDLERKVAKFLPGIEIPLRPFFGILATGPARSMGKISSVPPGPYGGNIDLNELTAGSTLFLPVHVPGALFMCGDGHAAQGDGEVDLTAIETSMTGTFRLEVIKGKTLAWPRAETPTHWICVGLNENLDEAMKIAIRETVKFLAEEKGLAREDAYALASIAVDFEVTQVVDQVKGIHAMIPKSIFV
jgi:acetamidase/formamidase